MVLFSPPTDNPLRRPQCSNTPNQGGTQKTHRLELRPSADRDVHGDQFQRSECCDVLLATIRPSACLSKTINFSSQKSPLAQKSTLQIPSSQKEPAAPGWFARPRNLFSQLFIVDAQSFVEEHLQHNKSKTGRPV
jgi:hypothetical protein